MAEDESIARRIALPAFGAAAAAVAVAGLRRRSHRPGAPVLAGGPLLIAHRGGSALAPENTLLAFERAIAWWRSDFLELDVQPTRDGEAVVIHDPTLERTTDGTGAVADHSLEQIRSVDAGYRFTPDGGATYPFRGRGLGVPTLAEVLTGFPEVRVVIEIKDGRVTRRVREVVREAGAEHRVIVAAGKTRDRRRARFDGVAVSAGEEELRLFMAQLRLGTVIYTPPVDAFQVPDTWEGREIATEEFVRAARRRNIPVHVWTVNEMEAMNRFLDRGAEGIVTDRPDRLARVLHARYGRPLPPGPPDPPPEEFLSEMLRE